MIGLVSFQQRVKMIELRKKLKITAPFICHEQI